jgi:signal transduction histidine kinase
LNAPTGRDAAVAAGTWVVAMALLVTVGVVASVQPDAVDDAPALSQAGWWCGIGLLTAQAAGLLRRRTHPRLILVTVAAAAPVAAGVGVGAGTGATSVAVIVAAYSTTLELRFSRAAPALAAATLLVAGGELVVQLRTDVDVGVAVSTALLQGVGTLAVPTLVGSVVRARRDAVTARLEQAQAVGREQVALVEVAVARERTAMARELHDIAAHHLSGIAVMTGAIGRQIDTDPEGAKEAVLRVRQQSTAMLRDMRRLVGLLREEPIVGGLPMPVREESLEGIGHLVESARSSGTEVDLAVLDRGDGRPAGAEVGPLAQLSAYRTVQEALANAARHAPGAACHVVVDSRDPARVRVTVANDPAAGPVPAAVRTAGGGYGLVGMRERAELTDARLGYGPTPEGGWQVSLALPTLDHLDEGET